MFVCFAGLPHFSTNVLSKAIVECVGPIRKKLFQVNKFQKWYFVSKIVLVIEKNLPITPILKIQ